MEPVRINSAFSAEDGQGLAFSHGGTCYAVFPAHVATMPGPVTVSTALPVQSGAGEAYLPFWEEMDLAVALVRYGLEGRCDPGFDRLRDARLDLVANDRGTLIRLLANGQVERLEMAVEETSYRHFTATLRDPEKEVFQGTSGAFFFVGDMPVGMAVEALDPRRARFVRIEEIAMNLGRWLRSDSTAFAAQGPSATVPGDQPGLAMRMLDAQTPPISPELAADRVLGPGAYVAEPRGPVVLDLGFEGEEAVTLTRVLMESAAEQGQAVPQTVLIQVDSSRRPPYRWRRFWSGDMGRDGVLDTGARAATQARRMRITIRSAWTAGPIRLDRIEAR
ncbi:MAG: hypothetical protein AAGE18_19220 [Pseudomonadota bacterium]